MARNKRIVQRKNPVYRFFEITSVSFIFLLASQQSTPREENAAHFDIGKTETIKTICFFSIIIKMKVTNGSDLCWSNSLYTVVLCSDKTDINNVQQFIFILFCFPIGIFSRDCYAVCHFRLSSDGMRLRLSQWGLFNQQTCYARKCL